MFCSPKSMEKGNVYNVVVIGGGASGTALLYTLAKYTNLQSVALIEKYGGFGQVNSNAKNNSQTLHVGDIETNYTIEKVRQVKPAAMMLKYYTDQLPAEVRKGIIEQTQKMVLAVGAEEVAFLEKRFEQFKVLFPEVKKLFAAEIAVIEPAIMDGRDPNQSVLALFNPAGYAVDFGRAAESLAGEAKKQTNKTVDIFLNREVLSIMKGEQGYIISTPTGDIEAETVVVDTDSYSLGFAKSLGYGEEYSLIPIAGTFYFTPPVLKGKVYTVQDPKLPFSAVHGDPDIRVSDATRWGPTARFLPVLESYKFKTTPAYFRSSGLGKWKTWKSFVVILFDPKRFLFLAKNILYILPFIGKYFFVPNVQKIAPRVKGSDLRIAKGFGGMRLQRVDIAKSELLLGEGKIVGDKIIFNMAPSPGASVCLYNGLRDAEQLMQFFGGKFQFDKTAMVKDLMPEDGLPHGTDISSKQSYAS